MSTSDGKLYTYRMLLGLDGPVAQRDAWDRLRAICVDLQWSIPTYSRVEAAAPSDLTESVVCCDHITLDGAEEYAEIDIDIGCMVSWPSRPAR